MILFLFFCSGATALIYEVIWSKYLALMFGSTIQAQTVVLAVFMGGLALGNRWIGSRSDLLQKPLAAYGCIEVLIGLYVFFFNPLYSISDQIFVSVGSKAFENGAVLLALKGLLSIALLFLPTVLMGGTLPLLAAWLHKESDEPGRRSARFYSVNSLGAVIGVLLTGFVLMPALGVRGAMGGLAILLSLLAALVASMLKQQQTAKVSLLLSGALLWICVGSGEGWRHIVGSGVFRLRATDVSWSVMEQRKKVIDILFYEDASDATVSVETRKDKSADDQDRVLRINGKPDASTRGDLSTQLMVAHLPMPAKPESKDIFVLGFGSGITAGALLGHPIERLTIAENCKPILKAGQLFEPWNRGVLTNARTHLRYEDGRTVLKLDPHKYDVLISEPSNPWVAGVGSVFSQEFSEIAASRLKDDGIMAQWFHIYEMPDGIVFLVLRTFAPVFPFMEMWDTQEGDIILLGAQKPWRSSPEVYRQIFNRDAPRQDLEKIGLTTPEAILSRQIASQHTAFAIAGEGPIQTDAFPVLEYAAPKAFYIGANAQQLFLFDERTWQTALAPAEKRSVLAALSHDVLAGVFGAYVSCNKELSQYLAWRKKSFESIGKHDIYANDPVLHFPFPPTGVLSSQPGPLVNRQSGSNATLGSASAYPFATRPVARRRRDDRTHFADAGSTS